MSLYRKAQDMLFENNVTIDPTRYSAEDGAAIIAMECHEELYDIFSTVTYECEQIELNQVQECAVLEGAGAEAVMEASIKAIGNKLKSGLDKVIQFFKDLWAKVVAFFKQVILSLEAIFKNGSEFVKNFKTEGLNLEGFEYKMYNYDDAAIDNFDKLDNEYKKVEGLIKKTLEECNVDAGADDLKGSEDGAKLTKTLADSIKTEYETQFKELCKEVGAADEPKEAVTNFVADLRGKSDRTDIAVNMTKLNAIIAVLKTDKGVAKFKSMKQRIDSCYSSQIKTLINKAKQIEALKGFEKGSNAHDAVEVCRASAAYMSKCQAFTNQQITAWKSIYKERSAAYKGCCVAAAGHKTKKDAKKEETK